MKGRGRGTAVQDLVAKGYSKSKATQALKDAGNNNALALRILERQKHEREAAEAEQLVIDAALAAQEQEVEGLKGTTASPSSSHAASIPSLRYRAHTALPLTETQMALQRQRGRRHPCVVQYGSCQYGEFCVLRDFPGDVCVQHAQGCCIYGTACRHRHIVDGIDVRAVVRERSAGDGGAPWVLEGDNDDVEDAAQHSGWGSGEAGGRPLDARQSSSPPPDGVSTRAAGWHADPFAMDGEEVAVTAPVNHPTPFLDHARAAPTAASMSRTATATARPTASPPAVKRRHPCVAQYGSCKYGDACLYADREADVCVHFLAGRCRFSAAECRYRHETAEEYQAVLKARVGLSEATRQHNARSSPVPSSSSASAPKCRLQGMGMRGAGKAARGRVSSGTASPSPSTASPLPSFDDLHAMGRTSSLPQNTDDDEEMAVAGGGDKLHNDAETQVFLGLVEAYPAMEPSVVLQALRLCGGDPIKTSDMMQQFEASSAWSAADVDSVAAVLALAAAEDAAEREAVEAAAHNARAMERHNALLTLLMLFPSSEVSAVEAVLSQQKGDFAAAFNVLLCAQERLAQRSLWQGSTASFAPADQLRYEKLCGMFPGLHPDIVRSAFCAAARNLASTTEALNELTKELLSLDATEMPVARGGRNFVPSATLQPAARTTAPARQPPSATATAEESSEAAYEAYRQAEKEILSYGDWRQVRQQAYLVNAQRICVLGQASAAFHQGDGRMAKVLSREGHRLAIEYNHLNRLAMLALEQERLTKDATSTLDLHGFHTAEVHDVVVRRVTVCQRRRIGRLRIVVGEGQHSKRGHASVYTTLMDELRTDAFLRAVVKVKSVKAGYVDVAVFNPAQDS